MKARVAALTFAIAAGTGGAQQAAPPVPRQELPRVSEGLYAAMRWRSIGPFRGGRVLAVAGVPGQPESFYFGAVGGGVWRTSDAGQVWQPVFDGPPSGSIGALAVAPSNPDVVYAGAGEADMRSDISYGDGVYRSSDGGRSWRHLGLADSRQIGRILVDPHDPDLVLVAALGHGFGPNPERGVFRSADGGKSWEKVLYRDDDTGAIDLAADPDDARTVYAALWNVRRPPWSTYAPLGGPGSGLYKSSDGGRTWRQVVAPGLPAAQLGRIGVAVAAGRGGRRVYALIDAAGAAGLYRSDDGGESWSRVAADPRITSRSWYFGGLSVDPANPDTVYVSNVAVYRSTDGGRSFKPIKGAPGGDDYHALWIDPAHPRHMILGCDQGAVVSLDGGESWSSWFNQPTAQMYHVAVDDAFPYFVYGAQQDSGTAAVASRSDLGSITFRDWYSVGTGESGYIFPDPGDAGAVYGGDTGGQLYRFDRRTGQVQQITPTLGLSEDEDEHPANRYPWSAALAVSHFPPHALYQGSQFVYTSRDRGMSWRRISPDLTAGAPETGGAGKGVIYTLALSPLASGLIWAGTDNGRIHLTRDDGRSWRDVTPPGLPPWSMVSLIAASPLDAGTAYAAIDRHQVDDLRPYALRTRDFGWTWQSLAGDLAASGAGYVHVVRPDPVRRGLLYAGTETGVWVSFDDGERWQPLQLDLPAVSVRDLAVKGDDLVAATHGRGFWILDDVTPLRQAEPRLASAPAHLFSPAPAFRLRRSVNADTPLPPETPAGANPPAGAILDYVLGTDTAGEVTLEILDPRGGRVRFFSSRAAERRASASDGLDDPMQKAIEKAAETESFRADWLRPASPLPATAGMHRFVWDLRYPPPPALHYHAGMGVAWGAGAPLEPEGPLVLPGTYRVKLTAGGRGYFAPLEVKSDPRVAVDAAALARQLALAQGIRDAMAASRAAAEQVEQLRRQLQDLQARLRESSSAARPAGAAGSSGSARSTGAGGSPGPASSTGAGGSPGLASSAGAAGSPSSASSDAGELSQAIDRLQSATARLAGEGNPRPGAPSAPTTLPALNAGLGALAAALNRADAAPTAPQEAAFRDYRQALDRQLAAWRALGAELEPINRLLRRRNLPPLRIEGTPPGPR
jgi:photosystem II stability/assembly factor-like uncharacterized protein